ncbi:MAG: ribbon-helix-helix protein, CopG family [Gemmatimonadetes bacterium]|jgi:hypothetical protein|nr:ribbon-helix-helix protein, CopG family [Gemmatimonadota bacterium]MBP6444701.1 ribbon-helix-helix protein, CopG family [Gemmatimonadales bacterium]MBP6572192.1 ribbon-helix-helix protein, CopG family [Gemmatimonadales bacterium]MBP7621006.1 ribbon-helix-helix protein, CopG family [Gemmatimonadales bacterium]MBP9899449.1 ribbon-helix-helix protein, CopG family [Gemmatimonadales bacterium]
MKDSHLTLRLPEALGDALEARAAEDRVPKSQVVREAVVRYLAPERVGRAEPRQVTARELAARWQTLPHLTPEDAAAFADDIARTGDAMPLPESPWA